MGGISHIHDPGYREDDQLPSSLASASPENPTKITRIQETIDPSKRTGLFDHGDYFDATVAANRLRPFARRRFRIARPAFVFIRSRKPCLRRRLIRLG